MHFFICLFSVLSFVPVKIKFKNVVQRCKIISSKNLIIIFISMFPLHCYLNDISIFYSPVTLFILEWNDSFAFSTSNLCIFSSFLGDELLTVFKSLIFPILSSEEEVWIWISLSSSDMCLVGIIIRGRKKSKKDANGNGCISLEKSCPLAWS